MEISPTTPATGASSKRSDVTAATNAVTGDFQTFLKLLTTQMRNQDPLKPVESTEFVSQLASFSGVEQQIRSNERLDSILEALSGGTPAGLAEWIGKEVRAPAKATYAGVPIEVGVTTLDGADRAVLVVRNDFDQVVARVPVAAGAGAATWDGTDDMGTPAAHGRYGFTLESYGGESLLGSEPGQIFATVGEVRIVDGEPVLVLEDGSQVSLDDISGVR